MPQTREWTKTEIQQLLLDSNKFVERAVIKLYMYQTTEERQVGLTTQDNGVGFNGVDAPFLTSIAVQCLRSRNVEGWRLSVKQREVTRRMLRKYAGQLAKIANGELGTTVVAA